MKKLVLLLLILSNPVISSDLKKSYFNATQNDISYQNALISLTQALEKENEIKAIKRPKINAYTNLLNNNIDPATQSNSNYNSFGAGVTLKQALLNKKNNILSNENILFLKKSQLSLDLAREGLIIRVSQSYFDLLAAKDDLFITTSEKQVSLSQLKLFKQRFEVGVSPRVDVQQAQAAFDLVSAKLIAAKVNTQNAKENLALITGIIPNKTSILITQIPLNNPTPNNINYWENLAIKYNKTIKLEQNNIMLAEFSQDKISSEDSMTIDLVASLDYLDNSELPGTGTKKNTSYLGLRLNMPLYTGGSIQSRQQQAVLTIQKSKNTLKQQKRLIKSKIRNHFLAVSAGISQVKAKRQALKSATESYDAINEGFKVGTKTTFDILNAQKEKFSINRDYLRSRYDYLLATLKLKQTSGKLTEEDLYGINKHLIVPN